MLNTKCRTLVGFSIKSKQILYGLDLVSESKKVKFIFYTDNLGSSSNSKLLAYIEKRGLPSVRINEQEMEWLLSRSGCKVIGLTNSNMCKEIARIITDASEVGE